MSAAFLFVRSVRRWRLVGALTGPCVLAHPNHVFLCRHKTVHAQLATRVKAEGVSLNTLVLTFIAQGLGRKKGRA